MIIVQYNGQLRQFTGCTSEEIELPVDKTISACVRFLADRHGEEATKALLDEKNSPRPSLLILVNDLTTPDTESKLKDGDELAILMPIAGG